MEYKFINTQKKLNIIRKIVKEYSIKQLAELVIEKVNKRDNKNLKVIYKPLPSDDPTQRRPDITLTKNKFAKILI